MVRKHMLGPRRAAAAVAGAAAIFVAGGFALDTARASAQTTTAQQQVSANWSGYVVKSSTGQSFSSVSGNWVEPSVRDSADQGYAAFWVGLGGASDQSQSLEQVGTAAQVTGGHTSYYAWYELVPSAQVTLPLTIHPGDHMSGRVTVNGTNVTISLTDNTTGESVTRTLQMSSPDTSSAEWIAEAPAAEFPNGAAQVLPLANFGKVTFSDASATAGGHSGSIDDPAWSVAQIDMSSDATAQFVGDGGGFNQPGLAAALGQQSSAGASAGGVSDNGLSFTVSYSSDPGTAQSSSDAATDPNAYGYPGYGYWNPGYGYGYSGGYGYAGGYGNYGYGSGYSGGYGYLGL